MNLFHLKHELYCIQSGILPKNLDANYFFLYQLSLCERVARTFCFMHQSIFRPIFIFNNDAYFLDFCAQKLPFNLFFQILFSINKPSVLGFLIMKNNIKLPLVKFWEDLLYFEHYMQIFVFAQNQ